MREAVWTLLIAREGQSWDWSEAAELSPQPMDEFLVPRHRCCGCGRAGGTAELWDSAD